MQHRVILVDTIQFCDTNLVDFPINENNSLDRCLRQKGTDNQKKQDSFHEAKLLNLFNNPAKINFRYVYVFQC